MRGGVETAQMRHTRVVLAAAHLDHNPGDNRQRNLKSLCQRCHMIHDRDVIAMRLGIEKTAMIRVRAGISYALTEAMDEGHCGLPTEELVPLAVELLEVPAELIQSALHLELAERTVIADTVGETA
jgi:hypothetical protein